MNVAGTLMDNITTPVRKKETSYVKEKMVAWPSPSF